MKIDDEMYDEIFNEDKDGTIDENGIQTIELNRSGVTATLLDWIGCLLAALVWVLILMTFLFRVIDVDGTSMEPTLVNTDKVVITDLFYTPHDNDIIVISHAEEYNKPLVKRVIATEGQTLKIDFDKNEIYVDGKLLEEDYTMGDTIMGNIPEEDLPEVIPEGKVFVLGDHRDVSLDSRYEEIGLIDVESIIGKAQFVIIPHSYEPGSLLPVLDFTRIRYLY
ncbi:MAG: signal peptidase I [Ruminococcus sp.]|nr:signal peptidase I [Ruminococcus sp.]